MGEVKHEVKAYIVDMICNECGKGYMRPIGNVALTSYPLQYPHQCSECGCVKTYTKTYPYEFNEYWMEEEEK